MGQDQSDQVRVEIEVGRRARHPNVQAILGWDERTLMVTMEDWTAEGARIGGKHATTFPAP